MTGSSCEELVISPFHRPGNRQRSVEKGSHSRLHLGVQSCSEVFFCLRMLIHHNYPVICHTPEMPRSAVHPLLCVVTTHAIFLLQFKQRGLGAVSPWETQSHRKFSCYTCSIAGWKRSIFYHRSIRNKQNHLKSLLSLFPKQTGPNPLMCWLWSLTVALVTVLPPFFILLSTYPVSPRRVGTFISNANPGKPFNSTL